MNKLSEANYLNISFSIPEDTLNLQPATVRSLAKFVILLPCSSFSYLHDGYQIISSLRSLGKIGAFQIERLFCHL
jgi:hypothetical protein